MTVLRVLGSVSFAMPPYTMPYRANQHQNYTIYVLTWCGQGHTKGAEQKHQPEEAMAAGHTDRADINTRKPLTMRMRGLLKIVVDGYDVRFSRLTNGDKNAARGLLDRGYVRYETRDQPIIETDAGRSALGVS